MKKYLKIGQVAERLNLDESTIRKYTEEGRIDCQRDFNNYRVFDIKSIERFEQSFLKRTQE